MATALMIVGSNAKARNNNPDIDYGSPPNDPLQAAKEYLSNILKDPDSAQYKILTFAHAAHCKGGWAKGGGNSWVGYAANVAVNSKNSFGGYTGYMTYTVLYTNGIAVHVIEGGDFGACEHV